MKKTSFSSNENFRAIFKDFPDAISVNRLSDGQALAVNKSFTALTGFPDAKIGAWLSFEDWNRLVAEVRRHGLANDLAVSLHIKNQGVRRGQIAARRIQFEGAPGLLIVTREAGEPQEAIDRPTNAPASKPENEEKYRAIFIAAPSAIFLTDPVTGAILEANPAACRMYGYALEELLGMHMAELAVDCDAPLPTGSPIPIHRNKGGMIFPVEVTISSFEQDGGPVNLLTVRDISERRRVEEDREGLLKEVQGAHAQLQSLSAQLFVVQENERRNIAYDLHDEIGQAILAIKANLETLQLTAAASALAEQIAASVKIADAALEQIRSLALDLRPAMLDDFGLAATLEWYLERQSRSGRFKISFQSDLPDELRFSAMIETAGFRVAQAAFMNIVRHAQAQHVHVTLGVVDAGRELELVIRDDGVGFDVAGALEQAQQGRSLGLLGLQERVRLAGGSSSIRSTPGLGTEVRVRFPVRGR